MNLNDITRKQQQTAEDTQIFLKRKLVQTHHKLIQQMDFNKQSEDQIANLLKKNEILKKQKQILKAKVTQSFYKTNQNQSKKHSVELDHKMKELINKNQLLRNDLEIVRNRLLNELMVKNNLQQKLKDRELKIYQLDQNYKKCQSELKKKQNEILLIDENYKAIQQKYEHNTQELKKVTSNLEQSKINEKNLNKMISELQNSLKVERQKTMSVMADYRIVNKQLKQSKQKLDRQIQIIEGLKNKIFLLNKQKLQKNSPNNHLILEKLTQEMNLMTCIYRQKQKKLQQITQQTKQKYKINNNIDAKELVQKLEAEQRQKLSQRKFDLNSAKKLTQKKQAGEQLNVSELQNIILDNNINKNKMLHYIDKIDQTKVKTHELLYKKKKLYDEITKIQQTTQDARKKLRSLSNK